MSDIKVRKIPFEFTDDIPFHWNPDHPYWGNFVNFITLIAPAFERYFIRSTREAMSKIKSTQVKKDAELFCYQEGQHSKYHREHLAMLLKKHPLLAQTEKAISDSYSKLFKEQSADFHLAYAATIELGFGPFAKFIINNIDAYFKNSDPRIASFILWHLVEEFEHRNAAIDIYNDVVGSYFYRVKAMPVVFKHLAEVATLAIQGLEQHTEKTAEGILPSDTSGLFKGIPILSTASLFYELFCTLLPYHSPNRIKQPQWVSQWFKDEAAGIDMRLYYS